MNNKILVLGTIAYDGIETPLGSRDKILGGCATYIGLSASLFSNDCGIVSIIGSDFKREHLEIIKDKGLDCSGVEIAANLKTFYWKGRYEDNLNSRITLDTQLNVLEKFKPNVPNKYRDSDILVLGNLDPNVQLDVLNQMISRPEIIILDTMNYWIERFDKQLEKLIKKTDIISINDDEARQITNEYSLLKAAKKISKLGPKFIIIKKGEHGAMLFNEDKIFSIPAIPFEEVYDPTGAGDSFIGAIAGYLSQTKKLSFNNLKSAIAYGIAVSSFTVQKFGTENLINLTQQELFIRMNELKKISEFEIKFNY
tara:strand:+ start:746 stop:1678 length:933 start_codon:yes stop_codon:yes gene_type:complete